MWNFDSLAGSTDLHRRLQQEWQRRALQIADCNILPALHAAAAVVASESFTSLFERASERVAAARGSCRRCRQRGDQDCFATSRVRVQ